MEVFRTDGNKKVYSNERLTKLIKKVDKYTPDYFFDTIVEVKDHKGNLMITVNDLKDVEYIGSVFQTFWHYYFENIIEIYYNGKLVKEMGL